MGVKYTLDELIVCRAAKEIKDGEIVVIGQGIPMTAGVLARATHAPNSQIVTEAGIVNLDPFKIPLHVADLSCSKGFTYACDLNDIFTSVLNNGYVDVAFLGVGQIDKYGNVNSSYVGGTPGNYEMRLTGAGGAPEFLAYARRSVFTMKSGQFVNKLDYMTSPGYLTGGDSRYMAGMPVDSGPSLLVTQDAIYKFDPITKEMFLAGLHPGVKVETVKAQIPWDLKIADKLEVTVPPTEAEVKFIRTYGPDVSMGRKLQIEAIVNQVFRMIEKMEKQKTK